MPGSGRLRLIHNEWLTLCTHILLLFFDRPDKQRFSWPVMKRSKMRWEWWAQSLTGRYRDAHKSFSSNKFLIIDQHPPFIGSTDEWAGQCFLFYLLYVYWHAGSDFDEESVDCCVPVIQIKVKKERRLRAKAQVPVNAIKFLLFLCPDEWRSLAELLSAKRTTSDLLLHAAS